MDGPFDIQEGAMSTFLFVCFSGFFCCCCCCFVFFLEKYVLAMGTTDNERPMRFDALLDDFADETKLGFTANDCKVIASIHLW